MGGPGNFYPKGQTQKVDHQIIDGTPKQKETVNIKTCETAGRNITRDSSHDFSFRFTYIERNVNNFEKM